MNLLDVAENAVAAGATLVRIDLAVDDAARRLRLSITDNGKGMDPALAAAADAGRIEEDLPENMLPDVIAMIEDLPDLLEPAPED